MRIASAMAKALLVVVALASTGAAAGQDDVCAGSRGAIVAPGWIGTLLDVTGPSGAAHFSAVAGTHAIVVVQNGDGHEEGAEEGHGHGTPHGREHDRGHEHERGREHGRGHDHGHGCEHGHGCDRVERASVRLNGETVVTFRDSTPLAVAVVTLQAENSLAVTSSGGGRLRVALAPASAPPCPLGSLELAQSRPIQRASQTFPRPDDRALGVLVVVGAAASDRRGAMGTASVNGRTPLVVGPSSPDPIRAC